MKVLRQYMVAAVMLLVTCSTALAQVDRHDVRSGNRKFRRDNFRAAEIDYRKAQFKDTTSVPAAYNLANSLYRQEKYDDAAVMLDTVRNVASSADYFFNRGDVALQKQDYGAAVQAFRSALILDPEDMDAKENYTYAKKMLQDQQQNGGGGQDDQNQDKQDQNQDKQDQNQDNQNQDQNDDKQDQNQDNQNQDNQDQPGDQQKQPQQVEAQISPQQAQQMLQAIQAKEKETQDKVNKEKAEALKARQKDKNW